MQISSFRCDIFTKNQKFKMADATILNFNKIANFAHCTNGWPKSISRSKFDATMSISDQDMAENRKSKIATATVLNFLTKLEFLPSMTLVWLQSISVPN